MNRSDRWLSVCAWCLTLIGVGVLDRWFVGITTAAWSTPIALEEPLSTLPLQLGSWTGTDVPIDQRVVDIAGADDFVNRRYTERHSGQSVNLYVAYAARPAKMLRHRPEVCYPAHGWRHLLTEPDLVTLADETELECLIHRFVNEKPFLGGLLVLNYYVLQGRQSTKWTDFWGPKWRRPNILRDPNYYVAQVQITSTTGAMSQEPRARDALKRFAQVVSPRVLSLLPNTQDAGGSKGGPLEDATASRSSPDAVGAPGGAGR